MGATKSLTVTDVCVAADTVECGYRIAELADGRFAFVWGNVRCRVGDTLPADLVADATAERGVSLHDDYAAAERAYRECAAALAVYSDAVSAEMLQPLGEGV